MLVLTRKTEQEIVINTSDGEIRIKIIEIGRDKVKVGFEAPPSVKILRAELVGKESNQQGRSS